MIETLEDFVREYEKTKGLGWIRTHRSGPTGVGKTLEDLLGIPENNLHEPDFGEYELKSCRMNSASMLTMFTLAPKPRGSNSYLRRKYGYSSAAYENNERVLHETLTAARFTQIAGTGRSLRISCGPEKLSVASESETENVFWAREALRKRFNQKYRNKFVYAKAEARGSGADEEFRYVEAYEVSGFSYEAFVELLEKGQIYIDLRIGQRPDGRTHDHGTAFRIREADQPLLFKINNRIA